MRDLVYPLTYGADGQVFLLSRFSWAKRAKNGGAVMHHESLTLAKLFLFPARDG
jgi:hypothetical protein